MKRLIIIMVFLLGWIGLIFDSKASAVEVSAGAMTWYAWIDDGVKLSLDSKTDNTFFFGPFLSVKFNEDFTLGFIFLYGETEKTVYSSPSYTTQIFTRLDGDLTLSYRLNDYFKIFGGIKYMGLLSDTKEYYNKNNQNNIGPAFGLSLQYHLIDNFFLLGNISGLYLFGKEIYKNEDTYTGEREETKSDLKSYGLNISLAVAYYITPASTTISLGGRYQNLNTENEDDNIEYTMKFYGITLSAIYSF